MMMTKTKTTKRTTTGRTTRRSLENPTNSRVAITSRRSLALLRQLARNAVVEGHCVAAGSPPHIPPVKPSTSRGITLAANFDRALRLNAGAFACRLADRDQQAADGPSHHDCETWHFSLPVTCTIGREYHRWLQVSSSRLRLEFASPARRNCGAGGHLVALKKWSAACSNVRHR
jgi:hypothetical protein